MTGSNNKLIIKNFILFIFGLYLVIVNLHFQNFRLYIGVFGLFLTVTYIFILPVSISKRYSKHYNKFSIFGILTTCLIAFLTILFWFKSDKNRLLKYGIITKAVIVSKEWLGNKSGGFQIRYMFKCDNEIITKKVMNQELSLGDTVLIKFDPQKPINNELLNDLN